jgi:hypothetical protein
MNRRIAAGFLAIFATGLIVAPVETAARGGGFVGGGRAMPVVRGFRGPLPMLALRLSPLAVGTCGIVDSSQMGWRCGATRPGTATIPIPQVIMVAILRRRLRPTTCRYRNESSM